MAFTFYSKYLLSLFGFHECSAFFRKKVNKKLSPAPFAIKASALATSSLPPACSSGRQMPRANYSTF
jgi:hypothetical protein